MHIFLDGVGLVGVALILLAYFLLQTERIGAEELRYSVINLVGSVLILLTLLFKDWNLPSFAIELFWILISTYGIVKSLRRRAMALRP